MFKMRFSLKVLAFFWVGLLFVIGVLLYNAYSRLKPETFIALLTEQVQKSYPGAKLNVGKVSYKFSLDFNLNLQQIDLRRSGKLLGSIGEVELKVPWWLLLFNRGNAQINLTNLDLYVDHADTSKSNIVSSGKTSQVIKVDVPSYLIGAKFTVRAKDVSIRDIHTSRRYFVVSKLLVREFQNGKNSAFELNIPITIKHGGVQYDSDLWLFGDLTPNPKHWNLNYRGEVRSKESNDKFLLDDLALDGSAFFSPATLSIGSSLKLLVDKVVIGIGELEANKEKLVFNLNAIKLPVNYFGFLYNDIKNPYLKNLEGAADGSIKFVKNFETSLAEINGKLSFDGDLYLSEKDTIAGKWQIGFQNSRWDISFISPKGEASFFRRSVIDIDKNLVTQYSEELGFSGLDLNATISPVMPIGKFVSELPSSYYSTSISYNKCLHGEKIVDGSFKYGLSPEQKFYHGELKDEKSFLKIDYALKGNANSIDLNLSNFSFNSSVTTFIPFFSAGDATVTGKVQGRWNETWETGLWFGNLKLDNLKEPTGSAIDFIQKTASFYEINAKDYLKQALFFSLKNNSLSLDSLILDGPQLLKINGLLSTKQKSHLTLSYPKKKTKPLRKDITETYWIRKD